MKLKTVLAALAAASATAVAANPMPVGPSVPNNIILEGDRIYIQMDGIPNPDNCGHSDMMVLAAASPAETERMFSMLMSSVASGKTVTVWVNGCSAFAAWGSSVPIAYDVQFHR